MLTLKKRKKKVSFSHSYLDLEPSFKVLDFKTINDLDDNGLKRIYYNEFSTDHLKEVIQLYSKDKREITIRQLRDLFKDMGFHIGVVTGRSKDADLTISYNINYIIPFWKKFIDLLFKNKLDLKMMFTSKFGPGKRRLHGRIYHCNNGRWIITIHVDMSNIWDIFNPVSIYKSHLRDGTGNYELGMEIMKTLLIKDIALINDGKDIRGQVNIDNIFSDLNK